MAVPQMAHHVDASLHVCKGVVDVIQHEILVYVALLAMIFTVDASSSPSALVISPGQHLPRTPAPSREAGVLILKVISETSSAQHA